MSAEPPHDDRPLALVVTPRLPWPLDDGGRIGLWQIVWSATRAYRVVLVSLVPAGDEKGTLPEGIASLGAEVVRVPHEPPAMPLAALRGLIGRWPYTLERYRSPRLMAAIRALARERRPVFALVNHLHLAPCVDALGPVPMVLREHNVETSWMERYTASQRHGLKRLYSEHQARRLRSAEAELCGRAVLVLAVQEQEAASLRALSPATRVETLPVGVNFARFPAPRRDDPPVILLVGSFAWEPNVAGALRFLAEGWPAVREAFPAARLRLAGKAPPPAIEAAARAAGAELAGHVPSMEEEFARATALVVPLWVGAGARVKIVEAMAARLPVVTTEIGAEGLGIVAGTHYLRGETPAELAAGVVALLRSADLRRSLEEAARFAAERTWSLEAVAALQNRWCSEAVAAADLRASRSAR